MSDAGGDIIIKGSSVHIHFNATLYQRDPSDPSKYSNPIRKISRIIIRDENDVMKFDSGDHPIGLKWTIEVLSKG
jgi:hypothetical protein